MNFESVSEAVNFEIENAMRDLQNKWDLVSLEKCIVEFIDYRGKAPPKTERGIPLITARNVRKGYLDFSVKEYIDEKKFKDWMVRGIPSIGDVLFTTEAPLGNVSMYPLGTFALGQRLVTLRPDRAILEGNFLMYFLLSKEGQSAIKFRKSGTTADGIKQSELRKIKIPLPPLPEQKKIAEILSCWDEAIEKTEKLIEAKEKLKRGLMQKLLSGGMRNKEYKQNWRSYELNNFISINKKKVDPKKNKEKLICIELEHIESATGRITGSILSTDLLSTKNYFEVGNILFGKLRPYLKKYAKPEFAGICSSEIWVLNSDPKICTSNYLFYLVQSNRFITLANASTGTKMPRADWSYMSGHIFSLPSLEEQMLISNILNYLDCEKNNLKSMSGNFSKQKSALMQQLLTGKTRVKI